MEIILINWCYIALICAIVTGTITNISSNEFDTMFSHWLSWLLAPILLFVAILLSIFDKKRDKYFKSLWRLLYPKNNKI